MKPQAILLILVPFSTTLVGAQWFGGWSGPAEWLPPSPGPRRNANDNNKSSESSCPGAWGSAHECVPMAECNTLPRRGFRSYCGWSGGALVCCPPDPRRQALRKPPSAPVTAKPTPPPKKPQQRCGLLDGGNANTQRFGGFQVLSAAIGGVPLRTARSSPWMVAVGERRGGARGSIDWFCGGSLLSAEWVLTAAHCAQRRKADVVRVGELDFSRTDDAAAPRDVAVTVVTLHPQYRAPSFYHDLALLRLKERVTFSKFVQPVCLPAPEDKRSLEGAVATLTGWGHTEFGGERSDVLREVGVNIVANAECEQAYSRVAVTKRNYPSGITQALMCAGDTINGGKDACQGDSGGPLVLREGDVHTQVGVVSSGVGCGSKNFPGVYVRVSEYTEWIRNVMR